MITLFLAFGIIWTAPVVSDTSAHISAELHYKNYRKEGKIDSALAVAIRMRLGIPTPCRDTSILYARSLRYIADCFSDLHENDSATTYYQNAITSLIHQKKEDAPDYASTLAGYGNLRREVGDFQEADSLLGLATNIYRLHFGERSKEYLTCYYNYILVQHNLGRYKESFTLLVALRQLQEEVLGRNSRSYTLCVTTLSAFAAKVGDYISAKKYAEEAVMLTKETQGDQNTGYINALGNLAYYYSSIEDNAAALSTYLLMLDVIKQSGKEASQEYTITLYNVGLSYLVNGDLKLGSINIHESLEKAKIYFGEKHPYYAAFLNGYASLSFELGDFDAAISTGRQALDIVGNSLGKDNPEYSNQLYSLTNMLLQQGIKDSTENYIRECLRIRKSALGEQHMDFGVGLGLLGLYHMKFGSVDSALHYFSASARILANSLGEESLDYATIINNIGDIYSSNNRHDSAIRVYKKVLDVLDKLQADGNHDFIYSNALFNLADEYFGINAYDSAYKYFYTYYQIKVDELRDGFSWLSTSGKQRYWQNEQPLLSVVMGLPGAMPVGADNHRLPFIELSYNCSLMSKALLLETSREVDRAVASCGNPGTNELYRKMKLIRSAFHKMQSEGSDDRVAMIDIKRQADSLDNILIHSITSYANHQAKFQTTWKDVKKNLDSITAAIEFLRHLNESDSTYDYFAIVVRLGVNSPQLVRLGSESEIRDAMNYRDHASLYENIWNAIDSTLHGIKRIYYCPVGLLNNVSFASLRKSVDAPGLDETNSSTPVDYLIDRYSLHRVTTTRYLADGSLTTSAPNTLSIALLGAIDYDKIPNSREKDMRADQGSLAAKSSTRSGLGSFSFLPSTSLEIKKIDEIMRGHGWKTLIYNGSHANESTVKSTTGASAPSILHFATHGFAYPELKKVDANYIDKRDPLPYRNSPEPMSRCGLMLSGANTSWTGNSKQIIDITGEDGILTASEVAELDLSNTNLVVLSACKTGLGKIEETEGTFGLQRGFKLAGVDNIIVSLWSVPDEETMELMTAFYEELAASHDPVSSFERAQNKLRRIYPTQPEKWAGFVLIR